MVRAKEWDSDLLEVSGKFSAAEHLVSHVSRLRAIITSLPFYFQGDVNRKPQGQIVLDEICRINRADGAATFEISTGKKTYYLTADSIATMEDWIRILQVCIALSH